MFGSNRPGVPNVDIKFLFPSSSPMLHSCAVPKVCFSRNKKFQSLKVLGGGELYNACANEATLVHRITLAEKAPVLHYLNQRLMRCSRLCWVATIDEHSPRLSIGSHEKPGNTLFSAISVNPKHNV